MPLFLFPRFSSTLFEVVNVDLLDAVCLPGCYANVIVNHELGQLFAVEAQSSFQSSEHSREHLQKIQKS
jgi:hypothetical protein